MGMLINGSWIIDDAKYRNATSGAFVRPDSYFRSWVHAESSGDFPAQAGRYQLLVAANCPWAHRTAIARRMKGLDHAIDILYSTGEQCDRGWQFDVGVINGPQPTDGVMNLHEVYTAATPNYSGRVTVPALWDKQARTIVNNESADLVRMLDKDFRPLGNDSPSLRPDHLASRIDNQNAWIYRDINNGVYRCGFATTQEAYAQACTALFAGLDRAEALLDAHRFIAGDVITEADVRLFPTLVRFDVVYYALFKCNLRHLWDYPNLSGYVRDLWGETGFGDTCDLRAFKHGYYAGIRGVNPNGVVPLGPTGPGIEFDGAHDRGDRTYPG